MRNTIIIPRLPIKWFKILMCLTAITNSIIIKIFLHIITDYKLIDIVNNIISIVINTIRNPYDTIESFSSQIDSQITNLVLEESLQDDDNSFNPDSNIILYNNPIYYTKVCKQDECEICLLDIKQFTEIFICNTCNHKFHYDCMSKWIKRKQTCPMCRDSIKTKTYYNKEYEQWINLNLKF